MTLAPKSALANLWVIDFAIGWTLCLRRGAGSMLAIKPSLSPIITADLSHCHGTSLKHSLASIPRILCLEPASDSIHYSSNQDCLLSSKKPDSTYELPIKNSTDSLQEAALSLNG